MTQPDSPDLTHLASQLGRVVRRLELGANGGLPSVVLAGMARVAQECAGNLADALEAAPNARFQMDSTLPDSAVRALADGLTGGQTPDSPADLEGD